jgi:predicted nucleic acid-binding protein
MSGKPKVYYWDACVYTAWLKKEVDKTAYHPHMDEILNENFQTKNIIITSTITSIEVLSCRMTFEEEANFKKLFRYNNHLKYDVDARIAEKARSLRDDLLREQDRVLSTPDAIHLATAILYGANEMHTFDDGQTKSGGKKSVSLLKLDNDPLIAGLIIRRPQAEQITLFHPLPKEENTVADAPPKKHRFFSTRDLDFDAPDPPAP